VRFSLAANGNVETAELMPASVSGTPLGACILRVARGTRFPPPGQSVAFRIPITARAD
jgi:hypothetical protein